MEKHTTYTDGRTEDKNITYAYENRLIYKYKSSNKATKEKSINEDDKEKNCQERSGLKQGESRKGEPKGKKTDSTDSINVTDNIANTAETEPILAHHYNHISSTTNLTNELGKVVEEYNYGTYGELLSGDVEKTIYLYNGMLDNK